MVQGGAGANGSPGGWDADRIGGLVWLLFGGAVAYGSWTMDRLETLGINPLAAPGLLPGLTGLAIMGFGLVMVLRRRSAAVDDEAGGGEDWRRLVASWALCIGFAGLLLGRGLPFWLLAAGFVFVHILVLEDEERRGPSLVRRAASAMVIALATAGVVTLVFQNLFLIRLP